MDLNNPLSAGDVVVRGQQAYLLVCRHSETVGLIKIIRRQDTRYRSHVRPDFWSDMIESGLQLVDVVIACEDFKWSHCSSLTRIGQVSSSLMKRIRVTIEREQATRAIEGVPGLASSLAASIVSAGRRVGVARYA